MLDSTKLEKSASAQRINEETESSRYLSPVRSRNATKRNLKYARQYEEDSNSQSDSTESFESIDLGQN